MKTYVDNMSSSEGAPRKKARIVSYSESAGNVGNTEVIGFMTFTCSERKLLDLYCRRGWSAAEGNEVLQLLRDPNFKPKLQRPGSKNILVSSQNFISGNTYR